MPFDGFLGLSCHDLVMLIASDQHRRGFPPVLVRWMQAASFVGLYKVSTPLSLEAAIDVIS